MPARLYEPLSAAACEEKYDRSESPGVEEKDETIDRDVEVEAVKPRPVLNRIDQANGRVDAERCEVLDERHVVWLEGGLIEQEFDGDRFAAGQDALAVLDGAACFLKKLRRLAQQRPIVA